MFPLITALLLLVHGVVPLRQGEGTHAAAPANTSEMYGHQFYPTPDHVIKRMLKHKGDEHSDRLWWNGGPKRILDPSAGSGAILAYIQREASSNRNDERVLHACEIDPELNAMLQGKGFTVVGSDFLEFKTENPYDLIIMNPPFDAAARHIVHAWDMLNGELVALCNAETVRNPRGEHAIRLKQLLGQGGRVDYIGRPFADADRETNVEVAMIRLQRSMDHEVPDWWKQAQLEQEEAADFTFTADDVQPGLVRYDKIDALVSSYHACKGAFRAFAIARERLYVALGPLVVGAHTDPVEDAVKEMDREAEPAQAAARGDRLFTGKLQQFAWSSIFSQGNYRDYATAGVLRNLQQLQKQQHAMAFTRENIYALLELLFMNRGEILRQGMLETFDRMCSYYPGNQRHWEGWKTNSAHMVNRKVVLPRCGLGYERRWGGDFSSYDIASHTDDFDRTMAMLEGRKLSDGTRIEHLREYTDRYGKKHERALITIASAIKISIDALPTPIENHHFRDLDNTAESEYFLIRYWKKGTVHLYFKDEQLWRLFNMESAKGKNWLPFDPEHVPTPKSTSSERQAIRDLEAIAEQRKLMITA